MDYETKKKVEEVIDYDGKFGLKDKCIDLIECELAKIFNCDINKTYFKQAVSGSGNELLKIDSMKSSSLLAFLFFQNVNKELKIKIKDEYYSIVKFEFKNKVFNGPSNIDVVLENEKSILFVECKFTEYLTPSTVDIRKPYQGNKLFKQLINSDGKEIVSLIENNR